MITIYKYKVENPQHCLIKMPENARLLSAGIQNDVICIWAVVDTAKPEENRFFSAYNTGGADIKHNRGYQDSYKFIGTVTTSNGIVWHVFEEIMK
jgi:hypothetical protein